MIRISRFNFSICAVACLLCTSIARAAEKAATPIPVAPLARTSAVDFETEILPLLRASCLACHSRTTPKAGLVLETPQTILKGGEDGAVVVPGKGEESRLLELAAHRDKPVMPPRDNKASAPDLSPEQLALLKLWIDQGARGEVHARPIPWQAIARSFTPAYATAVTADGQVAAVGRANRLDVYSLAGAGRLVASPVDASVGGGGAHRDAVYSLAFSPDGSRLASGSFGEVKVWRRATPVARFNLTDAAVVAVTTDRKRLAVVGEGGEVRLVEADTGKAMGRMFTAPRGEIRALRFSPDGERLFCATPRSVRVWRMADGVALGDLVAPAEIRSAAWTSDSARLFVGCGDGVVRLYGLPEAPSTTLIPAGANLTGHPGAVTAIAALSPARLICGGADGVVHVWDLDASKEIRQLAHGAPVNSLAVQSDGTRFASAGENGVVKVWDAASGAAVAEIKGDPALQRVVAEREADDKLAAGDVAYFDAALKKVEAEQKAQQERSKKAVEARAAADKVAAEKQALVQAAADAKGQAERALADANAERKRAQDAATRPTTLATTTPASRPTTAPADPAAAPKAVADAKAAAAKLDAAVKQAADRVAALAKPLADVEAAAKVADLARSNAVNEADLAAAAVARAGPAIESANVAANEARGRKERSAAALAAAKKEADAPAPIRSLAFAQDGQTLALAVGGGRPHVELRGVENGSAVATIDHPAIAVAFLMPDTLMSVDALGRTATAWDISDRWTLERTIGTGDAASPLSDRVNALAFSPDRRLLATGAGEPTRGGEVKLWDVGSGALVREVKDAHSDAVLCLAFSRDGARLASGAADRFVRVFEVGTGRRLQSLEGHAHHVLGVAFRADGRTLVSGAADGQTKLWDLVAGERKGTVPPAPKEVTSVRFVGVSEQAIVGSADGSFRLLNEAGAPARAFAGPADHVHAAALASGEDHTLIAAGQSGTLYVFDAATGKLRLTLTPPTRD
jgi:WD40 repeat protein